MELNSQRRSEVKAEINNDGLNEVKYETQEEIRRRKQVMQEFIELDENGLGEVGEDEEFEIEVIDYSKRAKEE